MSSVQTVEGQLVNYDEILSRSFYNENELETTVLVHLNSLLKGFMTIPFKVGIEDKINNRTKAADLAIIKEDFSQWYVVEVELQGHGVKHVEEQIESFYNCNYGSNHADYIIKQDQTFEERSDEIHRMIKVHSPKLLLIADRINEKWTSSLKRYDCEICEFQIYLNKNGLPAYKLSGNYPSSYTDSCFAVIKKGVLVSLELMGRKGADFCSSTGLKDGDEIIISFAGYQSKWTRRDDKSKIYLTPSDGYLPLDATTSRYQLQYNSESEEFKFNKV